MSTQRIYWGAEIPRLWRYTLLALLICCSAAETDNSKSIYWESLTRSNYQPPECRRTIKPAYFLENTEDTYRLVVTIPEQVSRKKLKIDVDYEEGHIEVFGWWSEGGVRGGEPKKMCVYGVWEIDSELLSKEAIVSSDLVSIYDMFMSIHDRQLILSVPMAIEQEIPTVVEDDTFEPRPPSPQLASPTHFETEREKEQVGDEEQSNHQASIVVAYGTSLWKQFRGLVRVKDHARINYFQYSNEANLSTLDWSPWDMDGGYSPPSSLAYEKYRQDALEKFLTYTMAIMNQNSN